MLNSMLIFETFIYSCNSIIKIINIKIQKMKKLSIIPISVLLAVIVCFLSCEKEQISSQKDFQDGTELALKILDFKEKMYSKNNDVLTLDEALENMELLVNASHGFPFEEYSERRHDVVSFQLQADENGNVSMADVNAAYNEMIDLVRDVYVNSGFDEKGLVLVTIAVNEEDKSGNTIDVNVATGKKGSIKNNMFDDCWYYGEDMGWCADWHYDGEMDGGDTIANLIASVNPIYYYNDCPGPDYHIILNPQPLILLSDFQYTNGQGESLTFYYPDPDNNGIYTEDELQLDIDEMNYYYNNEYSIIYDSVPDDYNYLFPDYVLVNCIINGKPILTPNKALHHENKLTYAERYWVHNGTIPYPTPIDL
jgi:hypothetical protein